MNRACPACGLVFEREPGYFVGAMYVSYALAVPVIALLTLLLRRTAAAGWPLHRTVGLAALVALPLVPALFRWSRIAWIHLDRTVDPNGTSRPR